MQSEEIEKLQLYESQLAYRGGVEVFLILILSFL